MPVSPGGTVYDDDELDALFKAVGFVVVQCADSPALRSRSIALEQRKQRRNGRRRERDQRDNHGVRVLARDTQGGGWRTCCRSRRCARAGRQ
jgi:hypothetical protein